MQRPSRLASKVAPVGGVAVLAAVALVAVGCSAATDRPATTGDTETTSTLAATSTIPDPSQTDADRPETSLATTTSSPTTTSTVPTELTPLQALMDVGVDADEYGQLVVAHAQAVEDAVAACLRAEGFDYVAVNMSDPAFGPISDPPPVPEGTETYGYAFTLRAAIDADGAGGGGSGEGTSETPNPNRALVDAMSQAEYEAFERTEANCSIAASESIPDPFNGPISDGETNLKRWLVEEQRSLSHRAKADPAVIDAQEAWSVCMGDSGFPYGDRSAIFKDLDRRFAPLDAAIDAAIDAASRSGKRPSLNAEDLATLDALEAYETQVFEADTACRESSGYDKTLKEVRTRLEADFVRENHDRLALIQQERRDAFDRLRELVEP